MKRWRIRFPRACRSRRARRSACRIRPRGVRSSCAPAPVPAKRCWCMARAAASASPPWSSDARTVLRVIGTAGTTEGLDLAREHGAHHVLNHRDADYLQQVLPLTGNAGVDVVLEMLANVNLDHDLDVLARNGRVVVIGNRGRVEIDPRKAMARDGCDPRHDALQRHARGVARDSRRARRRPRERHAESGRSARSSRWPTRRRRTSR